MKRKTEPRPFYVTRVGTLRTSYFFGLSAATEAVNYARRMMGVTDVLRVNPGDGTSNVVWDRTTDREVES